MTQDVLLTISGLQAEIDSEDALELITAADYYKKNGKHYLVYTELVPETGDEIKNTIKMTDERVDVIKHGIQNVHMIFEPSKKNISCYNTMVGSLIIGIHTLEIDLRESDEKISAKINYVLEINDNHVSDCEILLNVVPRQKGNLTL